MHDHVIPEYVMVMPFIERFLAVDKCRVVHYGAGHGRLLTTMQTFGQGGG